MAECMASARHCSISSQPWTGEAPAFPCTQCHVVPHSSGVLMSTDVMARGVDFPAVSWVIQFDPPSSSKLAHFHTPISPLPFTCFHFHPFLSFFVHRCGRTARMGQEGHALVLLTASELSYVDFLKLNKGVSLQPYCMPTPPSVTDEARRLVASER